MKRVKKTVASVMAAMTAVSAFSVVVSADDVKDAVNAAQQNVSATASTTKVDLSTITRKNTTIDVTIPNYQLRTTGLQYTWKGPLTIEGGKTAVVSLDTDIGDLFGATVTIVGVDGQTFTKVFSSNPEDENYNAKLFDGKKIVLDLAEIGKPSSIQSVYTNAREGEDTDVLYGEDVLTTPAISSITVTPLYGYDAVEPWKKSEIETYNNKVKGAKAEITYTHPYFVKQVTENGTQYNEITVNGVPGKEYDGYEAYLRDEKKFQDEASKPLKNTNEVVAGVPAELIKEDGTFPTAEEVWTYFSKQVGDSTDAVENKWEAAALSVFDGLTDADFEKTTAAKYALSATVGTTSNFDKVCNAVNKFATVSGEAFFRPIIADAFGSATAKQIDISMAWQAADNAGKTDATMYIILSDKVSGAQAAYKSDLVSDVETAASIVLKPVAVGTDISKQLNNAPVKQTTVAGTQNITLTKTTDYDEAVLKTVKNGAVWATGVVGTYTGDGYESMKATVADSVKNKVPAGIDFSESIKASLIQSLNKQVGNRVDSNATLTLNTTVITDTEKVAFTLYFSQKGTGTLADKDVVFQSSAIDVNNLPDELVLSNGSVAVRLKVSDKAKLKAALITERAGGQKFTAWIPVATDKLSSNLAGLGTYYPAISATSPDSDDVIEKMTKAGLTKPTKSAWKFKTAEKKPQDLDVNAYKKGESAYTSKSDFLATYPNVIEAIKNMKQGLTAWDVPPDGSTYPGGHEPCTGKKYLTIELGREYDPSAPTAPGSATSTLVKKNRVFGVYNKDAACWESAWANITAWPDYYVDAYNSANTTSAYAPGVLAEMNDIIGSNKGAVISIHLDPNGFEDFDSRSVDSKRWFAMNNSCVLRVNGVSSGQYANLVSYDPTASTFSFNWDDIAKDKYSDTSVLVRALEILTSEKAECDTITISIPDQKAYIAAITPTEVKPDNTPTNTGDDKDTVIEIKDGDKTNSDNQEIAPPDDSNTPPTTTADVQPIPDDVTTAKNEDKPPVTTKDVVDVTVPSNNNTPTTGEPVALGIIPLAVAGVVAALKKKIK